MRNAHITEITDEDLADHDTGNFQVGQRVDPIGIASFIILPAIGESIGQKRLDGTDGEQDITGPELANCWRVCEKHYHRRESHPSKSKPAPGKTMFLK